MELLVLFQALIGAAACYYLATQRGRNPWIWLVLGLFFGVLAIVAILVLPDKSGTPGAYGTAPRPYGGGPAQVSTTPAWQGPPQPPTPSAAERVPPASPGLPAAPPQTAATNGSELPAPPLSPGAPGPSPLPGRLSDDRMPCPRCGESIASAAKVCRFCGHELAV